MMKKYDANMDEEEKFYEEEAFDEEEFKRQLKKQL